MNHSRLIEHYHYALNTMQFDEMHDLMTVDFHFKNPSTEIWGRENYIHYIKNVLGIYKHETISLKAISDHEYQHEFYLTFLSSADNFYDNLFITGKIKIRDSLLSSYSIEYDLENIPPAARDVLMRQTKPLQGATG